MKRFTFAIILVLAFCADSFALNLRPYMQTPPEVQVFAKRVIEDGGQVVDLEYCQKYTRLSKQLMIWSNGKFVGDANMGVKLNSGVSVQTLYDLSGNNNDATQATVGNQPIWTKGVQGGRSGVSFTAASSHFMNTAYSASLDVANITLVSVYRNSGGLGAKKTMTRPWTTNWTTAPLMSWGIGLDSGAAEIPPLNISTGGARTEIFSNTTYGAGANVILIGTYNGTTMNLYANLVIVGTSGARTGDISYNDNLGVSIGCRNYSGGNGEYLNGISFHNSIFSTALITAQRTALGAFVNAYFSIY